MVSAVVCVRGYVQVPLDLRLGLRMDFLLKNIMKLTHKVMVAELRCPMPKLPWGGVSGYCGGPLSGPNEEGCKSKRPLVKTPPSQNVPELVKTSPNTKIRLVKTSP